MVTGLVGGSAILEYTTGSPTPVVRMAMVAIMLFVMIVPPIEKFVFSRK